MDDFAALMEEAGMEPLTHELADYILLSIMIKSEIMGVASAINK